MADANLSSVYFSARPDIFIDGKMHQDLSDSTLTVRVEETEEGLFSCEALFGNWAPDDQGRTFLYLDRETLDFGKNLSVHLGDKETGAVVFDGVITGLEGHYLRRSPPQITALAEDRLQDLRMVRRTRSFEDVTDEDVIRQIAGEHGMRASVDIDGPTYRVLTQVNQSDLAFIRERARAVDAEVWIEEGSLSVKARTRRDAGEVELTYGDGLWEFSVLADLACQRTSTTVSGWDVAAKEGLQFEAGDSQIAGELNGGLSGPSLLKKVFGERPEHLVHHIPHSETEARALAEAAHRRTARRFVTGQGLAQGDGRLRVGTRLKLKGLGPLFVGAYYVTQVCHLFDGKLGYRTQFHVERADIGEV